MTILINILFHVVFAPALIVFDLLKSKSPATLGALLVIWTLCLAAIISAMAFWIGSVLK